MRHENLHAAVAQSAFWSQNAHLLIVRNMARGCGAKHISNLLKKTEGFGPLLEVAMLQNGTPLGCEAHFQVKMNKAPAFRSTFGDSDVEKLTDR